VDEDGDIAHEFIVVGERPRPPSVERTPVRPSSPLLEHMDPMGIEDLHLYGKTRSLRWCADTMLVSTFKFMIIC
jgi:hypothetical protein